MFRKINSIKWLSLIFCKFQYQKLFFFYFYQNKEIYLKYDYLQFLYVIKKIQNLSIFIIYS